MRDINVVNVLEVCHNSTHQINERRVSGSMNDEMEKKMVYGERKDSQIDTMCRILQLRD